MPEFRVGRPDPHELGFVAAGDFAGGGGPGSWRRIATPPIPPAGGMAAAWTGRQLVVWGGQAADGQEPAGDGAAYDPAADRWEELPPAPIAARFGASAVWTGREVLFWGGQGGADHDLCRRRRL